MKKGDELFFGEYETSPPRALARSALRQISRQI